MNLERYFDRIGFRATSASFDTLAGLLDRHMTSIPFENLDVLLKRTPKLDTDSLMQKLVVERRGGYCYEHATLFAAVLCELGFAVKPHSARVTMLRPKSEAPRTHMFLTVVLPEGTFVLDPGFGGLAPRVPVNIDGTRAGCHWIADGQLMLETPEKTAAAWVSSFEEDYPIDFEMANYFTATSPLSPFTSRLMMRAFTANGRVTVMNRTLTLFPSGETRQLGNGADLRDVAREHFGFDLPALDSLALPG